MPGEVRRLDSLYRYRFAIVKSRAEIDRIGAQRTHGAGQDVASEKLFAKLGSLPRGKF